MSGGWCNIDVFCVGHLMLVSSMGRSMGYSSSSCSEDFRWRFCFLVYV
jgi:hypothetical protein